MQNKISKIYLPLAVIILGFAAVIGLSKFLEKNISATPESYADSDLSLQGEKLKGYAFGAEGLIADWYWIRSLQYIGNKVQNNKDKAFNIEDMTALDPRLLYPLLDNATSLDPQFDAAYSYGAIVLPAINKQEAIKLVEKGIENNPEKWRFYQHLGYIYWKIENFEKAAVMYEKGSQLQDSPPYMKMMTANMKSNGGSRQTARAMYENMYNDATDPQIKESAALRILQIESLDERDAIQQVLDSYRQKNSTCPVSWKEIFPLLKNIKLENNKLLRFDSSNSPIDPTDIAYQLFKKDGICKITLNYSESKIPAN